MTPPDDLKVGMMVAVVNRKTDEEPDFPWGLSRRKKDSFTGIPLEIKAISLPFICVTDGEDTHGLDMREWDVKKLGPRYVKMMTKIEGEAAPEFTHEKKERERRRKRRRRDPRDCPRCGDRLIQIMKIGNWTVVCKTCGYEGENPTGP